MRILRHCFDRSNFPVSASGIPARILLALPAHEVGHHVQNLLGTMAKVQAQGQNNQLSVALELQADCYAGIWANHAQKRGQVEVGDIDEALRAAAAVGDDMIQRRTQGYIVPESFTHGSADQRQRAFAVGMKFGNMQQCEVFK